MVYGDGAFKDPQGKIWELADPVVSPAFTDGLIGTPSELKLKYLADNDFKDLSGDELKEAISKSIRSEISVSNLDTMQNSAILKHMREYAKKTEKSYISLSEMTKPKL